MNRYLRGAVGGLAGTFSMTATMMFLFRFLPVEDRKDPLPPRPIILRGAEWFHLRDKLSERQKWVAIGGVHFAYGALTGSLYPLFERVLRSWGGSRGRSGGGSQHWSSGFLFGFFVWAGSYLGWLPLSGLFNAVKSESPKRMGLMIVSTMVWGAVTVWTYRRLTGFTERDISGHPVV